MKKLAKQPLLKTYIDLHNSNIERLPHGERYTSSQKDIVTYEYLSGGNPTHEFKERNMKTASKSTVLRHINNNTRNVKEGVVDAAGLKKIFNGQQLSPRGSFS